MAIEVNFLHFLKGSKSGPKTLILVANFSFSSWHLSDLVILVPEKAQSSS